MGLPWADLPRRPATLIEETDYTDGAGEIKVRLVERRGFFRRKHHTSSGLTSVRAVLRMPVSTDSSWPRSSAE